MEQSDTRARHDVATRADAVSETEARIVSPLRVHHSAGPCLPVGAEAGVDREALRCAPVVLNEQAAVGVIESPDRAVADRIRIVTQLKDAGIERRLIESRALKAFVEEHHGRVFLEVRNKTRTRARIDAEERRLERIEQGEGLGGANPVVVSAEGQGVLPDILGDVVDNFEAFLFVEVRIAAIDTNGELVGDFHVRLRAFGREVVVAVRVLHAKFVDQRRRNRGGESADE